MQPPRHKAACSFASAAASFLLILASSGVSGAALPESHAYVGPQMQIKADGNVATHSLAQVSIHKAEEADGDVAIEPLAQENIHRAGENLEHMQQPQKLMRTETDESRSPVISKLEGAPSQTPSREVDCSASAALDPISNNFCTILDGSNWQVSGKLERAVKKMHSLATGVGKDVEQDALLQTLQGALWELWFCAKRITPKCFPSNSTEEKYQVARNQAWSALAEMKQRAGVTPTRPPAPRKGFPAVVNLELSARKVAAKDGPSTSQPESTSKEAVEAVHMLQRMNLTTVGGTSMLQNTNVTEDAQTALQEMLSAPNVLEKLQAALERTVVADSNVRDIVTIHADEGSNIRRFKDNLMILHECASMPQCPADHCCTPANPQDQHHADAFHHAYEAFLAIQQDENLAMQDYLDIVGVLATSTTSYEENHALHVPTPDPISNQEVVLHPRVVEEQVVQEDPLLFTAILVTSGLVVLVVLVLVCMSMGKKTGAKPPEPEEETEEWGEEYQES